MGNTTSTRKKELHIFKRFQARFLSSFDWTTYVLAAIVFIAIFSHGLYVLKTFQFPQWDEHLFMEYTIAFYDILSRPKPTFISELDAVIQLRQPLYPLTLVLPLLIFGTTQAYKISLFMNGFYFCATIIGIYLLGRVFFSKTASVIAAFLFSVYGFPLYYLHFVYSETAATTWVVYSLYFLAKSHFFRNRRYTLFFGLSFCFGILTRWTTPVYILGPAFFIAVGIVRNIVIGIGIERRRVINNIMIFILFGIFLPVFVYYGPKIDVFLQYLTNASDDSAHWVSTLYYLSPDMVNTFSTRSIMFYFNILSQQTVYFFALFCVGFVLSIWYYKKYIFFLLAFLIPYSFFTFVTVFKDDRFILLIYPIMALISAVVIERISHVMIKRIVVISILVIGIQSFLAASWGIGPMGSRGLKDIVLPEFIHHPRRVYLSPMVWPPQEDNTSAPELISFIENDWKKDEPPVVVFGYRYHYVDAGFCKVLCYEKRYLMSHPSYQIKGLSEFDYVSLFRNIQVADYFLIKRGNAVDESFYEPMIEKLNIVFEKGGQLPSQFTFLTRTNVPIDGSAIELYKRTARLSSSDIHELKEAFIREFPEDKEIISSALTKL